MSPREGTLDGDEARRRLYRVMRSDRPFEARMVDALEVGAAYFGVDHAYMSDIDAETGTWETVVSIDPPDGPVPEGLTVDLAHTYCKRTIAQSDPLALHDAVEQGWGDDAAYQSSGFRCYHGAAVVVDGETYGTVCFSSADPRAEPFSDAEKTFTELLSEMAGHELERQRYERRLQERERELDEREEVYRAVLDASFDMVFRVDCEGTFTYQSESVSQYLGYDPTDLEGESFGTVVPDEAAVELGWDLLDRTLGGETVEEAYFPLEAASGSTVYVDVRLTPIYRSDVPAKERSADDVVEVQGVARDATDRKRRERLIRVLHRVLRHNLRNDMTVVEGSAEALAERLSGENRAIAERISDTADGLVGLSEVARRLERTFETPPELESMDVVPVVERTVRDVADEHPDARMTVDAPSSAVAYTAPRIETAVEELVENAVLHAGDAPTVEVSVSETDQTVTVRVTDDGPGLPESEREVLTTGEETPLVHGSGLGLWLVYWIVTGLDGTVSADEGDDGATVEIRLPRRVE